MSSKDITSGVMPFIDSSYLIFWQELLLVFLIAGLHGKLVEIGIKLVLFEQYLTVVSYSHTCLLVTKDLILLNLRETRAWHDDATPLIFVDLVVRDVIWWVEKDQAITVVVDVVMLYPRESCFDRENTFWSWLVY